MTGQRPAFAGRVANTDEMRSFMLMPSFDNLCVDLLDAADDARKRHGESFPFVAALASTVSGLPGLETMTAETFIDAVMSDCPPDGRQLSLLGWKPTVTEASFHRHSTMQRQVLAFMSWYESFDADAASASRRGDGTLPFGQSAAFYQDFTVAFDDIAKMGNAAKAMRDVISVNENAMGVFNFDVFCNVYRRTVAQVRDGYDHENIIGTMEAATSVTTSKTSYEIDLYDVEPG